MSNQNLMRLENIYRIHDAHAATLSTACGPGCAACCTRNVAATTLEAFHLLSDLSGTEWETLRNLLGRMGDDRRFRPKITVNGIARMCMEGKEPPEEENDPEWGVCPFLHEDRCRIYGRRPFGCRLMVSRTNCRDTGSAEMDSFTLTVNTVCQQVIEHADREGGYTGNWLDLLAALTTPGAAAAYARGCFPGGPHLIPNLPVPVLMAPPEHQERIRPIAASLTVLFR